MMKILVSTGIRSDYDILYPVLSELKKAYHELVIVVSGAHLSNQHNNTYQRIIEDGFKIADKVDTLLSTDRAIQRSKGTGLLIQGLTQTVERTDPDFLLVLGDREESIATAIVGNYMEKLVVHIGGGDPVYGNADDPVRFAVSKL
ncbi:MAG: UDP-N-acetylglucosamine 2-epimerase, partial [Mariniphaga sp.]|nr:UDP-N-acetylglucosamine 2-epimerase [Mariniphaga sp.]